MKDYYDLYYFHTVEWKNIDKSILKESIKTTFKNRDSIYLLNSFSNIITEIANSDKIEERW